MKPWVLVTPASRGIGLELARRLLLSTKVPIVATARKDLDEAKVNILSGLKDVEENRLHVLQLDVLGMLPILVSQIFIALIITRREVSDRCSKDGIWSLSQKILISASLTLHSWLVVSRKVSGTDRLRQGSPYVPDKYTWSLITTQAFLSIPPTQDHWIASIRWTPEASGLGKHECKGGQHFWQPTWRMVQLSSFQSSSEPAYEDLWQLLEDECKGQRHGHQPASGNSQNEPQ